MDNDLIWSLLKPSQLILYGVIFGVLLRRRSFGRSLLVASAAILIVCAVFPVGALLTAPLENRFPPLQFPEPPAGIIVLAGAEKTVLSRETGESQLNRSGDRLTSFLMLAHQFPEARLAHVGAGSTYRGTSQSNVARDIILGTGVDSSRIVFESKSRNTCEGARLAFQSLNPEPDEDWLLVTSAYDMPRAIACFRATDWRVVPHSTDYNYHTVFQVHLFAENLANIDLAVHEWIGLFYYRILGRTREIFPAP